MARLVPVSSRDVGYMSKQHYQRPHQAFDMPLHRLLECKTQRHRKRLFQLFRGQGGGGISCVQIQVPRPSSLALFTARQQRDERVGPWKQLFKDVSRKFQMFPIMIREIFTNNDC